jgi:hypothetical protein
MITFAGKAMIGDGKYIVTRDSADTWDATALDLPSGYVITCLAVYGNRLIIGTQEPQKGEGKIFTWDGVSDSYIEELNVYENGVFAMFPYKNYLLIFAGLSGNIYLYNGASLEKIKKLPNIDLYATPLSYGYVGPVVNIAGNIYFSCRSSATGLYNGLWCLGQIEPGDPISLTLKHLPSGATAPYARIYAIYSLQEGTILTSWSNTNTSAFGIDVVSSSAKFASAIWESQIYEISNNGQGVPITGIELIAKPMSANTAVVVKYKLDNASSWTTGPIINSTNQNDVVWALSGLAKTIQVRLEFTVSGNNSPQISSIRIY